VQEARRIPDKSVHLAAAPVTRLSDATRAPCLLRWQRLQVKHNGMAAWQEWDTDQKIEIVIGVFAVLVGVGLTIVQMHARNLQKRSHSNPGLAPYRFKWYRLAMAMVALVVGFLIILRALGVV
jgi:hypothetical protein